MSGDRIAFDGTALAQQVPQLGEFYELLAALANTLGEFQACRWADGTPASDEMTMQALATVQKLFGDNIVPILALIAESVGIQGEKLDLVRQLGENTEANNAEIAGSWGGRYS